MSTPPRTTVDTEHLRRAIVDEYDAVARDPGRGFHFHTGRPLAAMLGYDADWLQGMPDGTIASFAGTGNPFRPGALCPGERVVDVGCGAGTDAWIAAHMVGTTGRVIGVDMTPAMLEKARQSAAAAPYGNLEVRDGLAERLPVPDGWADVVISNGVLNLVPDKRAALAEMRRVLKPGGRIQLADIVLQRPVPEQALDRVELWTGWIAGALLDAALEATVVAAGFTGFRLTWKGEVYAGAKQASSAERFGTLGVDFCAVRA